MKILFDTNVVLDVLLDREPFVEASAHVLSRVESGQLTGYLCASTITTLHYLMAKSLGNQRALSEIRKLLSIFEIAPVNRPVLEGALETDFKDFEDGVIHESARLMDVEAIVTRNETDFEKAGLAVYSPEELARALDPRARDAD